MRRGRFFKIFEEERLIGGYVLFSLEDGSVELGRAFLEPESQNRGIGGELLRHAEDAFPATSRLVLDTPAWNERTRHFYEKAGYVKVGEIDTGEGFTLFQYEKRIS